MPRKKNAGNNKKKKSNKKQNGSVDSLTCDAQSLRIDYEKGERYARVTKALGGGRFYVQICQQMRWTTDQYIAVVPGKMRGRSRYSNNVSIDSVLTVGLREYESRRRVADVLRVFSNDEVHHLMKERALPTDHNEGDIGDVGFTFVDVDTEEATAVTTTQPPNRPTTGEDRREAWNTNLDDFDFDNL